MIVNRNSDVCKKEERTGRGPVHREIEAQKSQRYTDGSSGGVEQC